MIARYPGNCVVCGGEIVPRETEIEAHPTIVGPRGGKKMAHVSCISKSNPMLPTVRRNGGCGCGGYGGSNCGCGDYHANPRGGEHSQLMALVRQADAGQARKGMAEQEAFAEYEAERAQSRRGRRSR